MSETTTVELPLPPNSFARSSPFTVDESMNLKKTNSNTKPPTLVPVNLTERERKQELPPKDPSIQPLTNTTNDTLFVLQVLRTVLNLDQPMNANEEEVTQVVAQVAKDGKQEQSDQLEAASTTAAATSEPASVPPSAARAMDSYET